MTTRIGIIGEDDYDIKAVAALMKQRFDIGFKYLSISKHKTGSQIFTKAAISSFSFEINKEKPDFVVIVIDADAVINEAEKISKKREQYLKIVNGLGCKSLLLLNIYELEALILADIEMFNSEYRTNITHTGNVMHRENPKEILKEKTAKGQKKYQVSHGPDLFKKLRFDVVAKNCNYFNSFIAEFEEAITN